MDDKVLRTIFDQYDVKKDGKVNTCELKQMCASLNLELTDEALEAMMARADPNKSGSIEFEEFRKVMNGEIESAAEASVSLRGLLQTMRVVFDTFDKDKSGSVSTSELKAMCEQMKLELAPGELEKMMKEADPDGSGEIDFGEFVVTVGAQMKDGGRFAEVYNHALAAVAEAEKQGATWIHGLNPLVAAAQLAKARKPMRRAFPGAPTNASYSLVAEMGTPDDADWYERGRDNVLGFFIRLNRLFMVLAALSALCIAGFGVTIAIMMFSAVFGAKFWGLTDFYPECTNETASKLLYIQDHPGADFATLTYEAPTHNTVDLVNDEGMHGACTEGQTWFNICIKVPPPQPTALTRAVHTGLRRSLASPPPAPAPPTPSPSPPRPATPGVHDHLLVHQPAARALARCHPREHTRDQAARGQGGGRLLRAAH